MNELEHMLSSRVEIAEGRPPRVALTIENAYGRRSYGLEPAVAFELAHSIAMLALQLEPALVDELRRRTRELIVP